MKHLILIIGSIGILLTTACQKGGDGNRYSQEMQSCVDFGGGCDPSIYEYFNSSATQPYPGTQGAISGYAGSSYNNLAYYKDLDRCGNETINVNGQILKKWVPAILPRNGGLVCLSSDVLNEDTGYYGYGYYDISSLIWSEFNMYNYFYAFQYNNLNPNPKMSRIKTHYISLTNSNNSTNTDTSSPYNNFYPNFEEHKIRQTTVDVPLLCELSIDVGLTNHRDCGVGATCNQLVSTYYNARNLGICMN